MADLGAVKIDLLPYRLRFKRPFGTAHGMRDGTDSVLIRVEHGGSTGYGEATTPPYVEEDQASVLSTCKCVDVQEIDISDFKSLSKSLDRVVMGRATTAARAGLHTAFMDLIGRRKGLSASAIMPSSGRPVGKAIYTLGICELTEIDLRLAEMPDVPVLKVKLDGSATSLEVLAWVSARTKAGLLLDANQGLRSVDQARQAVKAAGGPARVVAMEQPFHKDALDDHAALGLEIAVPVIADESIQGLDDLEARGWAFGGVNLKLMKCGGLDRALAMAERASALGKLVMLGSMSESSLGCAAMAALGGWAELCDLDGPWLIDNDPFTGFVLHDGTYRATGSSGFGVEPVVGLFEGPIGA